MPLIKLSKLQHSYGEQIIFDECDLQLEPGDRLCIIGRNGVGKSTLLKVIAGKVAPDGGSVWQSPTVVVAGLAQDLPEAEEITVVEAVARGVPELRKDLAAYEQASLNHDLDAMAVLQARIETADGWNLQNRIDQVLSRLDLNPEALLGALSGGWRRRVALAQALVARPSVLLLDEPTNHLDIAAIEWLEEAIREFSGAVVFITHDRAFLRRVANRIAELDRGELLHWRGDYDGFLQFKAEKLETEARHNALFDKKLAQEEVWIRQGIKARRTRNEGRVRALESMRRERSARRERQGGVSMSIGQNLPSGKLVAELLDVSFCYDDTRLIDGLSTTILRGDKVGLLGPNGIGKSTLLKLILGELQPSAGHIRRGTKLEVAYFDQLREQLDLNKNAIDNIAGGRESIEINGKQKHIIGYLQDFLFSGERARTAIGTLSGGERNRVLLAKLFSQPSNLLILDEPTNDLDSETLELLENLLVEYEGTVLLVSHDREFLDNVVANTLAFEGQGRVVDYVGGYQDWRRQGGVWPDDASRSESVKTKTLETETSAVSVKKPVRNAVKKLSYQLQRELDALPAKIEALEKEIDGLQSRIAEPDFYNGEHREVAEVMRLLAEKESEYEEAFNRWEFLEAERS